MDPHGNIYELTDEQRAAMNNEQDAAEQILSEKIVALREDVARLDGYLRGREEEKLVREAKGKGANRDLSKFGGSPA